jgi:hypothetical protein
MMKVRNVLLLAMICLVASILASSAEPTHPTVIFDRVPTKVGVAPASLAGSDDLWITLVDLTRATKFVLKPQGVCRDELCFPIPKSRRQTFLSKQGRVTWFNLTEFARLVRQPVAIDRERMIWYFGPRPAEQNDYLSTLVAPDFTLPDVNGRQHSLSNFRGKKVLLLTWASW